MVSESMLSHIIPHTIFKSLGVHGANAGLLSTGVFGILKGVASVAWVFFLVDTFGRRFCICYLSIPCTLCMWYIGAYVKLTDPTKFLIGNIETTPQARLPRQCFIYERFSKVLHGTESCGLYVWRYFHNQ